MPSNRHGPLARPSAFCKKLVLQMPLSQHHKVVLSMLPTTKLPWQAGSAVPCTAGGCGTERQLDFPFSRLRKIYKSTEHSVKLPMDQALYKIQKQIFIFYHFLRLISARRGGWQMALKWFWTNSLGKTQLCHWPLDMMVKQNFHVQRQYT